MPPDCVIILSTLLGNVGVIQRQGIKDSIVAYIGVALGALNTLFIYTLLPKGVLGLFQYLISTALIAAMVLQLGMTNVTIRFFPVFKTEDNRHNGFLGMLLLPPLLGVLLFVVAFVLLFPSIQTYLVQQGKDPLIQQYLPFLVPLAGFMVFNGLLTQYTKNFLRIVVPTLLESVWLKIATGTLALLFIYGIIQTFGFIAGIVLAYGVVTLGLFAYLRWLGQLSLKPNFLVLNRPLLRQIGIFAFYGILGSVGGSLMTYIDRTMIPLLVKDGLDANGIFSIVAYIGTAIDIPRKSIEKITAPVVANAIEKEDWQHVEDVYRRSSLNLLIIGALLFLGVWLNMDSVFAVMKNGQDYLPYKNIVLILGISSLIDMVTSINTHIISLSRYFRFAFYLIVVLAGLNVGFNYLFMSKHILDLGIQGAALATFTSIVVFNTAKFLFIYKVFKMQPFSRATLWILLLAAGVYGIVSLLPSTGIAIADILYKSFIITSLYLTPILYFRFSPDLNQLVLKIWTNAKKRLHF